VGEVEQEIRKKILIAKKIKFLIFKNYAFFPAKTFKLVADIVYEYPQFGPSLIAFNSQPVKNVLNKGAF
jgi:hypothetical protein